MNKGISKFSKKNDIDKHCVFNCHTCNICKEFITKYYENAALIRDNDENVHILKVVA
jgi:hypothetical protein